MSKSIRVVVVPYALYDVVKAFNNETGSNYYTDVSITKEDGDLVVIAERVYLPDRVPSRKLDAGHCSDCPPPLK